MLKAEDEEAFEEYIIELRALLVNPSGKLFDCSISNHVSFGKREIGRDFDGAEQDFVKLQRSVVSSYF